MLVLGNDYKHPAVVAKEAATLDVLSDGRLEFGLGAGWMTADYDRARVCRTTRPGMRIERLAEALAVVKGAWGDGPFDFAGDHYTITAYDGAAQAGAAAAARRSSSAVAAASCCASRDARPTSSASTRSSARARSAPRRRATRSATRPGARSSGSAKGRGSASTTSSSRSATSWPRSPTTRRRSPRPWRPRSASTPSEALGSGGVLAGSVDEVCDTLVARREEWGVSYVVFGDDNYEEFAPVVARLAGT